MRFNGRAESIQELLEDPDNVIWIMRTTAVTLLRSKLSRVEFSTERTSLASYIRVITCGILESFLLTFAWRMPHRKVASVSRNLFPNKSLLNFALP